MLAAHAFGSRFNPVKAVRKGAKAVKKTAASPVKTAKRLPGSAVSAGRKAVKKAAKVTVKPLTVATAAAAKGAFLLATKPLRVRINRIKARRALKLAMERRKSRVPTAAEKKEAREWTKAKLKSEGPHGQVLALLAGPADEVVLLGSAAINLGAEPATMVAIQAAIPILTQVLNKLIQKLTKSGDLSTIATTAAQAYAQQRAGVPVTSFQPPVRVPAPQAPAMPPPSAAITEMATEDGEMMTEEEPSSPEEFEESLEGVLGSALGLPSPRAVYGVTLALGGLALGGGLLLLSRT
jgi:hypothetical protein